jgi:N-acyl-D-aspartate/D-glutamate deacylase
MESSVNGTSARRLLLRGGTVLIHDEANNVQALQRDVLIENNRIARIASDIGNVSGAEVIECDYKIISPGFFSTTCLQELCRPPTTPEKTFTGVNLVVASRRLTLVLRLLLIIRM